VDCSEDAGPGVRSHALALAEVALQLEVAATGDRQHALSGVVTPLRHVHVVAHLPEAELDRLLLLVALGEHGQQFLGERLTQHRERDLEHGAPLARQRACVVEEPAQRGTPDRVHWPAPLLLAGEDCAVDHVAIVRMHGDRPPGT